MVHGAEFVTTQDLERLFGGFQYLHTVIELVSSLCHPAVLSVALGHALPGPVSG
jgi:hypothetical protein